MKLFLSRNCQHFLSHIDPALVGKLTVKQFSDGELYVKIEENVFDETVWVIASTKPPAESILELFFILDALDRNKACINLLLVYSAYTRQDRAEPGEALSAEVFFNSLATFCINKCVTVHVHGDRIKKFYDFENFIPYAFFERIAQDVDTIAAPDTGAQELARTIAQRTKKGLIVVEKRRPAHEMVEVVAVNGSGIGKSILLVDDVISTGNTLVSAAHFLEKQGARTIIAAATHGIFAGHALSTLTNSPLNKIYVTNTIDNQLLNSKIEVIDIWPELQKIIFGK